MQHAASVAPRDPRFNAQIDAVLAARHADPFALLGPHPVGGNWTVRFFLPWAAEASISLRPPAIEGATLSPAKVTDAAKLRPEGFFEATWPSNQSAPPAAGSYKIQGLTHSGDPFEIFDPYAFPIVLSEFDLYLMGEGRHYDTYEKLGAHVITLEGVQGVHFAVWAPSARRVSVVGDFNGWDGRVHSMRARGSSGLWEIFVPELNEGAIYKYEIVGPSGTFSRLKPIPTPFTPSFAPILARSSRDSITTNGMTPTGSLAAPRKTGLNQQSPSMKSISVPGAGSLRIMIAGLAIENSVTS